MDLNEQAPNCELFLKEEYFKYLTILSNYNITVYDIITKSVEVLQDLTIVNNNAPELKLKDLSLIKRLIDKELSKSIKITKPHKLTQFTSGSLNLDKLLNGGIPLGLITEVSGESSSGKTQLLLQISLYCQTPKYFGGLNNENGDQVKVFYLSTESALPTKRINQLIETEFLQENYLEKCHDPNNDIPKLDNIIEYFISKDWDLKSDLIFFYQLPKLLKEDPNIKVVIIDSISHHLRSGLFNKNGDKLWEYKVEFNNYLNKLYTQLQYLAETFEIAIIVSNQVTSVPLKNDTEDSVRTGPLDVNYQLGWNNGWDNLSICYTQAMINGVEFEENKEESLIIQRPSKLGEYIEIEEIPLNSNKKVDNDDEDAKNNKLMMSFPRFVPCLNQTWANKLPIRLYLSQTNNPIEINCKRREINNNRRKSKKLQKLYEKLKQLEEFRLKYQEKKIIIDRYISNVKKLIAKEENPMKLLNLEKLKEEGYQKKHFFLKVTNSVLGFSGHEREVVISNKGFKLI